MWVNFAGPTLVKHKEGETERLVYLDANRHTETGAILLRLACGTMHDPCPIYRLLDGEIDILTHLHAWGVSFAEVAPTTKPPKSRSAAEFVRVCRAWREKQHSFAGVAGVAGVADIATSLQAASLQSVWVEAQDVKVERSKEKSRRTTKQSSTKKKTAKTTKETNQYG